MQDTIINKLKKREKRNLILIKPMETSKWYTLQHTKAKLNKLAISMWCISHLNTEIIKFTKHSCIIAHVNVNIFFIIFLNILNVYWTFPQFSHDLLYYFCFKSFKHFSLWSYIEYITRTIYIHMHIHIVTYTYACMYSWIYTYIFSSDFKFYSDDIYIYIVFSIINIFYKN